MLKTIKKITYSVAMPDGTTATRKSARDYTHAIVSHHEIIEWGDLEEKKDDQGWRQRERIATGVFEWRVEGFAGNINLAHNRVAAEQSNGQTDVRMIAVTQNATGCTCTISMRDLADNTGHTVRGCYTINKTDLAQLCDDCSAPNHRVLS